MERYAHTLQIHEYIKCSIFALRWCFFPKKVGCRVLPNFDRLAFAEKFGDGRSTAATRTARSAEARFDYRAPTKSIFEAALLLEKWHPSSLLFPACC